MFSIHVSLDNKGEKKSINSSDLYKTDVQKFSRVELVKEGIGQGFK